MTDWTRLSSSLNYGDERSMWEDLYTVRKLSISQIARKLDVSSNTVRASLMRHGVTTRKRGGPNNQRLVVTDELVDECRRDGIAAVARRLDLDYTTVYKRLYRVRGLKVSDLRKKREENVDVSQAEGGSSD